ncbi:MAG: glycosyltransferase family 10 fucosyltransferase [Gemmatimonadetes bacterium]|nr:glycosyltransferase family 10 fucosyltransferase [Gemmatimonadota bacterium]
MFGSPLGLEHLDLPDDFAFTEDRARFAEADAVVFHGPELPRFFRHRKRRGQLWVLWSMECDAHYPRLRRRGVRRRFDLRMTYRRDADVFVSYAPLELLDAPLLPPRDKTPGHLVCSFISGRHDRSGRTRYLRELSRHVDLHAYGRLGDREIANDQGRQTKLATIAGYKFTIAFENAISEDYVTEKFYDPLLVGSVPIYLGAPNVVRFAPTDRCYLDASDFVSPAALARRLLELDRDDDAYRDLLDWRDRPVRADFLRLMASQQRPAFERLYERLRVVGRNRSG